MEVSPEAAALAEAAEDYLLATAQYRVDVQMQSAPVAPIYFSQDPFRARLSSYEREVTNVTNINTTIHTAGMVNINPESVNVIQSHIEAIGSREPELAQALARLTEALDAPEFTGDQREELRAYVEDLTAHPGGVHLSVGGDAEVRLGGTKLS